MGAKTDGAEKKKPFTQKGETDTDFPFSTATALAFATSLLQKRRKALALLKRVLALAAGES